MPYKRQKSSFQPYRRSATDILTSPIILPPIIPRVIKPKAVTPNKVAKRLQVVSPTHVDTFFKSMEAHPGYLCSVYSSGIAGGGAIRPVRQAS